jgi:hypothetical protein
MTEEFMLPSDKPFEFSPQTGYKSKDLLVPSLEQICASFFVDAA